MVLAAGQALDVEHLLIRTYINGAILNGVRNIQVNVFTNTLGTTLNWTLVDGSNFNLDEFGGGFQVNWTLPAGALL